MRYGQGDDNGRVDCDEECDDEREPRTGADSRG